MLNKVNKITLCCRSAELTAGVNAQADGSTLFMSTSSALESGHCESLHLVSQWGTCKAEDDVFAVHNCFILYEKFHFMESLQYLKAAGVI